MSEKNKHIVGYYTNNPRSFDDYRNMVVNEFTKENLFRKRKLTQAAYWTAIEKELANQIFRDEVWIFGMKVKDELKLIDHGWEGIEKGGIGFKK